MILRRLVAALLVGLLASPAGAQVATGRQVIGDVGAMKIRPGFGATPVTLGSHVAGWYNVLSFGADPTGVADSTAAIQAAVTAAASGVHHVFFPAGLYRITAAISVPTGVHLHGVRNNVYGQGSWIRQDSADYHLTLVGTSGAYVQYAEVEGLVFTGANGLGIRTAFTEALEIHHNTFSGTVYGLYMSTNALEQDVKAHIHHNTFGGITNSGIWAGDTRTADTWIEANVFNDCYAYAIRIGYMDGGFVTRNAVFSDLSSATENNGILIHKPSWARIADNQLFQVNGVALWVTSPVATHIERNVAVWTGQTNRKTAFNIVQYSTNDSWDVWIRANEARQTYGVGFTIDPGSGGGAGVGSDYDVSDNKVRGAGHTASSLIYDGFVVSRVTRLRMSKNTTEGESKTRYWANLKSITGGTFDGNSNQGCVNAGAYLDTGNTAIDFHGVPTSTANGSRYIAHDEGTILADASGGGVNLTLPSTTVAAVGRTIVVTKTDATGNAVALVGQSGQTVNGAASMNLTAQYQRATLLSDGTNWTAISVGGTHTGNSSGTNTGDVTIGAVGTASANGATLSGQALSLTPQDATHPGIMPAGAETLLMSRQVLATLAASTAYQRTALPSGRGFTVTAVTSGINSGPAASGAGTIVFRTTDGTNNCDCTANCTTTAPHFGSTNSAVRVGSCTGTCSFAAGSSLLIQTTTANCATTLPTVVSIDVHGYWQ